MAHASVRLRPGADQNETPALNEAGFSQTQLIRFTYDRQLGGNVQKLGGWQKFVSSSMAAIVRALWAWEDTNGNAHLAVGTQNIGVTGHAQLAVITNGSLLDITPQSTTDNVTPAASATSGSAVVTLTDATTPGITSYDSVFITTHISVGGLVLFGQYATALLSGSAFNIEAIDILGNPQPATSTTAVTAVASFATANGTNVVTVTLANHGYAVGSTYPVLVSTSVGGVTVYGNYTVASVPSSSTFTINVAALATSSTSASINGGNMQLIFSFGVGAIPAGTGYGIGAYGSGGYGTGTGTTPSLGTPIAANDWTLDNWGETLIACPDNDTQFQPIYQWTPSAGNGFATVIPEAPTTNDGVFVAMPQRQVVAWGSTQTGVQDPLLIRWCDVNNYDSWIPTVTNQAGSYRIPKGSKVVGCIQGPQQGLVWTDVGVWAMQYQGPPFVYAFNEIGSGCGLIGRKAAATINGTVYWMGASQFYMLGGDGVAPVPCPVWDVIFQDLDQTRTERIRVAVNSRFGEISWFYPTMSSGGEVNAYVKYNAYLNCWDFGLLARSAWIDQSVLGPPIGADPNSLYIYQHETSTDADGQPLNASFQTGYYAMDEGDFMTFVDQVWPDFKFGYYGGSQNATILMTFYVTNYPGDTPTAYGPFTITQATEFISPRLRGRLISIAVQSNDIGSFWRLGDVRYRLQPDGRY